MLVGMAAYTTFDVTALARVCAGHAGVRLVALFGSVAREAARADSDVGGLLGREPHVVDLQTASDWLRFQVARDGVLVYEALPGAWAEFKARAMVLYWDLAPTIALCAAGVKQRFLREARHG